MATAIILTGGKSSRFGKNKALVEIDGEPLARRIHDLLLNMFNRVLVIGGQPEMFKDQDLEVIQDRIHGVGALGGIYTGLVESSDPWIFAVACDMPSLNNKVIEILIKNIGNEDILCPRIDKIRQPLHAIYHKSCIEKIEILKHRKDLCLPLLFENADVRFLSDSYFKDVDNYKSSFVNFNTPRELENLL
ncbi:MAG: molybdenum cofactor guanylyltransferase [Candidatus Zixiibacteriota bacterium]|nr:MAG: molybdenum cofactor guanylyltransferase [candidate division Zixibacteria bacterium]